MWSTLEDHGLKASGSALVLVMALLVRWVVSLHGYSGMATPPMFGDYEAQRHWMELTFHLPISRWYFYDLQYWGLDYPPLTAYVSYICGAVANAIEPALVSLDASRGYETETSKVFMRLTVVVCDLIVFIPALALLAKCIYEKKWMLRMELLMLTLMQPAFILIDHGHFQYNNVTLGLTTLAVVCILRDYDFCGAVCYCLALNFKQMSLYYAPAITFYLLAKCWYTPGFIARFLKLAVAVIGTFALLWAPFCIYHDGPCADGLLQVLHRIFPVGRGLFEDKVANVWCCLDLFFKLRQRVTSQQHLVYICATATLVGFLPSVIDLLRRPPTRTRFFLALFNCSMSFFLFSYQVHEKSILLPLLPMAFLMSEASLVSSWFAVLATFSMYFLLAKDGLLVPYLVGLVGYVCFGIYPYLQWPSRLHASAATAPGVRADGTPHGWQRMSLVGIVLLHIAAVAFPPPAKYPHLHQYTFALYSCGHFVLALAYTTYWQWTSPSKVKTE
ncbi:dolichyl pyrophosphate Man9GlcNAc2 alpha-1,3-glucosyltransferase [Achlya hypogyna]|uniref:Alpha-1,3-glucosyltransferase n=1 Tax=Achlya hypogyna TaxID=1202772 RepID=A0A1V9Z1G8_ACHHY|nr:dolichyl pyrophosphate Man9GlcNAc2 alpha-1,3-glucosyltransferase [Achlya hypogyna]